MKMEFAMTFTFSSDTVNSDVHELDPHLFEFDEDKGELEKQTNNEVEVDRLRYEPSPFTRSPSGSFVPLERN